MKLTASLPVIVERKECFYNRHLQLWEVQHLSKRSCMKLKVIVAGSLWLQYWGNDSTNKSWSCYDGAIWSICLEIIWWKRGLKKNVIGVHLSNTHTHTNTHTHKHIYTKAGWHQLCEVAQRPILYREEHDLCCHCCLSSIFCIRIQL